ncbi:MAG: AAA family ATPase, partial [Spirochaetales bacterium]|nr:AAA family ATPase [Spirochaetales bacterium]
HELVETLKVRIRQELAGELYKTQRDQIVKKTEFQENHVIAEFEGRLNKEGYKIVQLEAEEGDPPIMDILPLWKGEAVSFDDLQDKVASGEIDEQTWNQSRERYYLFIDEMKVLFERLAEARRVMEKDLQKLQVSYVSRPLHRLVQKLGRTFPEDGVKNWLASLEKDVENHLFLFLSDKPVDDGQGNPALIRYAVNVLVDHGKAPKLPVVFEHRPTASNLFGTLETRGDGETRPTFLAIRPGALHQASGGYLVLRAEDILAQEEAWPLLKQVLETRQVEIQVASGPFGPTSSLKPIPIEVNLKVIIVGTEGLYDFLIQEDRSFGRLFKISAEFDSVMPRTPLAMAEYLKFMDDTVKKRALLPLDPAGSAEILEYGVRLAEHRGKLSTRFSAIADLLSESSYWAAQLGLGVMNQQAVQRALEERKYLFSLPEEKMDEQVREGQILLAVTGTAVGVVNGLAILDRGSYSFGRPMRITATAAPGDDGIVNIEGEAGLSGEIHDKGVLILRGLLRSRFAQDFPLSLSASVGFEQSYSGVDGDSASSTEVFALLSAISGVPLRQDLAVSGSINQRGEIQPVGGITEKVEGFFYTCSKLGLTGTQGVIIPHWNIQNLVLNQDVQKAVREKRFHIYPVKTLEEALFLLTGKELGQIDPEGQYPEGTLGQIIVEKLALLRELAHPKEEAE